MKRSLISTSIIAISVSFLFGCEAKKEDAKMDHSKMEMSEKKVDHSKMDKAGTQKNCPVMGGTIIKDQYVDYKGQRVYFCCPGCESEFSKEPEKYIQKITDAGEVTEKL